LPPGKWFAVRREGVAREQFDQIIVMDGWTEASRAALDRPSSKWTKALHALRDAEGNLPHRFAFFHELSGAQFYARDRAAAERVAVLLRFADPI
jgi:hypothetical protein